jgi:hypothetical protein
MFEGQLASSLLPHEGSHSLLKQGRTEYHFFPLKENDLFDTDSGRAAGQQFSAASNSGSGRALLADSN